jgi:hypothetical protein
MMARCECIKCGKAMKNFQPPEEGLQPIGGLAFQTRGHYGSAYFDGGMGYLEIALCDVCVEAAEQGGLVFRSEYKP